MPRVFYQWSGLSPLQRFERQAMPEPNSGCWLWIGSVDTWGYAQFNLDGKRVSAHRWSYEHYVGAIPDGLQIDHLCRVQCCVNPDHLEPVTAQENVLRRYKAVGRRTHCRRGHPYTGDNLTINKDGSQICRTCNRMRSKARYQRLKATRERSA